MATHKRINSICWVITALCVLLTVLFCHGEALGLKRADRVMGYEAKLFDTETVHTVDIIMDDWDGFLSTCENEEYAACTVVIDGEAYKNVGIRAKGNTSLSQVSASDSDRYSFKVEFDQYEAGSTYHGLDKLCLNNIIQDNTFMKDYLVYRWMAMQGAAAPLCSYAYLTVNGEDFGLYLAVEAVEDSFLQRNFGSDHGELYKPDSMDMGGGRGNGRGFDMEQFAGDMSPGGGMSGAKLQYTDDNAESYGTVFESAKTDVTEADKTRLIGALRTLSGEDPAQAVDTENTLRYFAVHNFAVNGDSYTGSMVHNYYLYEKDGKLTMIPWDYNLAFGTFQSSDAESAVNDPIDTPLSAGNGDRPMADWIFTDAQYTAQYHEYLAQFLNTTDIQTMIEETYGLIKPYVEKDPTKFCTTEEFEAGKDALAQFCQLREESILAQLDGSISATDEGQQENAARIETGELDLNDMGGFHAGGMQPPGNMGEMPQFGGEMPQFDGEAPQFDGEMPQFDGEAPQFDGEAPQFDGEMPQFDGEMPQFGGEMPQFDGEAPQVDGEAPQVKGEAPHVDGEMPQFGGEMPQFDGETPQVDGESGEAAPVGGEEGSRQSPPGGRGGMNGGPQQGFAGETVSAVNWKSPVLLAASALVLAAGLFIAIKFKR